MSGVDKMFSEVSLLSSTEKLLLVDKILTSLNPVNHGAEAIWNEEAEERITAYRQGRVPALDEEDALKKYSK
ncbi:addiction module protein [Sulfurovum sp.]|uniref:addiction module protein n=1 Tax=Sulfurovum sp. TaxID=1969726 RepID=UPI002867C16C|nr:addiction module protein [Sulfurovum sp.]